MKKTAYQKELAIKATQKREGTDNNKRDVMKIQSWLTLFSMRNPDSGTATGIDGDFGPATERAVKNFQSFNSLTKTGIVDQELFDKLSSNLKEAFEKPLVGNNLRSLMIEVAENHLKQHPFELEIQGQSNSGPWVRSYMDGHDGSPWFWCMGFAQTILDQASSAIDKNFKALMPLTYSCDTVGNTGLEKGLLSRYQKIRRDPSLLKQGDIFLIQKSRLDWTHTGVIIAVEGDVIETVEGNTNHQGSRNGVAVMKRTRSLRRSKIDVFSIEPLV
ncbi:peptidoglycan-binding protein [Aquimarina sp. BL5]|uniref:peptidoglycan-binding domain-containing protein n=1 Tax=Aquimarina sp. BL5 TaxID=1714860 RepID=UPI000E531E9C|nr:peptidoglycan-binding domain-containing protein [Aquimarina sp. BL5]AXT53613.1 peptidoglycan-binding protein [Aquimarina sp. BL5]RKM97618.1 peptidoglycan-binding protein [Aquimarina sp. BL5]